jgi:hypothetical protein
MWLLTAFSAWPRSRRKRPARRRAAVPSLLCLEGRQLLTHFRYGNLWWEPAAEAPNTVTFHLQLAFRRDFFILHPNPQPGEIIEGVDPIQFGDGTAPVPVTIRVLSVDAPRNYMVCEAVRPVGAGEYAEGIVHTYAQPGSYTAFVQAADRLSELRNNADFSYRLETLVRAGGRNASPVSGLAPIVQVADNTVASFRVPAVDREGDGLRFRLATSEEASGGRDYVQPPGLTISPDGVVSWDIRDAVVATQPGDLWTAQVVVEELDGSGIPLSSIPVDFLLKVVHTTQVPPGITMPEFDAAPEGPLAMAAGQSLAFTVQASDADVTDTVSLQALNPPTGMTFEDIAPAPGSRPSARAIRASLTPTAAQASQIFVVLFQVTDSTGLTAQRAVILQPAGVPPGNQAPVARANGPYTVASGGSIVLSSAGSTDPDGSIVRYEWDLDYDGVQFQADAIGASPTVPAASAGVRTIALRVTDNRGASTIDTARLEVTDAPALTGQLDPASDTGVSNSDRVTRDNTPTFHGHAAPGSTVVLLSQARGGGPAEVGRAQADSFGQWSITAGVQPDGETGFWATLDQPGAPTITLGSLVIDTVGPQIATIAVRPRTGRLVLGIQDDRSGLDDSTLGSFGNYELRQLRRPRARFAVTAVTAGPAGPANVRPVVVQFNGGRRLAAGRRYVLTVRSGGIADRAGNPLDGEFSASLPSGNGAPGGDFQARLPITSNASRRPRPLTIADRIRLSQQGGHARPRRC